MFSTFGHLELLFKCLTLLRQKQSSRDTNICKRDIHRTEQNNSVVGELRRQVGQVCSASAWPHHKSRECRVMSYFRTNQNAHPHRPSNHQGAWGCLFIMHSWLQFHSDSNSSQGTKKKTKPKQQINIKVSRRFIWMLLRLYSWLSPHLQSACHVWTSKRFFVCGCFFVALAQFTNGFLRGIICSLEDVLFHFSDSHKS